MRIIAGEFRRRILKTPKDDSVTRPITDRVKESLFGLLRGHCEDAFVFDAFAGTGAIGLEAVSRGAAKCVFVEQNRDIAAILQSNIDMLNVGDRCRVVIGDALGPGALARAPRPLTLAFFDPPYALVQDHIGFRRVMAQLRSTIDLLKPDGFAVLRTPWPLMLPVNLPAAMEQEPSAQPQPRHKRKSKRERHNWLLEAGEGKPEHRRRAREPRLRHPEEEEFFEELTEAELAAADAGEMLDPDPNSKAAEAEPETLTPDPKIEYAPADLLLPNALGPETHVYHNMAIHLYARKP